MQQFEDGPVEARRPFSVGRDGAAPRDGLSSRRETLNFKQ